MFHTPDMTALVTAGDKFLGRCIVRRLLERGNAAHVFAPEKCPELESLGAICHTGDICNYADMASACQGIDTVFHTHELARIAMPREAYFRVNAKGTANVIRACVENKVSRLVHTSTSRVVCGKARGGLCGADESVPYPLQYNGIYPASRAVAEKMVLAANGWEMVVPKAPGAKDPDDLVDTTIKRLATCALRPHLMWGPGEHCFIPWLIKQARKKRLRQIGDGQNKVQLTYVDNAAKAHILAADHLGPGTRLAGETVFIADGSPLNLWDWVNEILSYCNLPPTGKAMSYANARRLGFFREFIHRLRPSKRTPKMTVYMASMLSENCYTDKARAYNLLGYTPDVKMEDGLQNLAEWIKSELL